MQVFGLLNSLLFLLVCASVLQAESSEQPDIGRMLRRSGRNKNHGGNKPGHPHGPPGVPGHPNGPPIPGVPGHPGNNDEDDDDDEDEDDNDRDEYEEPCDSGPHERDGGAETGKAPANGAGLGVYTSPGARSDEDGPESDEPFVNFTGPIREVLESPYRQDPGEPEERKIGEVDRDGNVQFYQRDGGRRQLNVFLPDTRIEVNEVAYPYRTAGKFRGCTATLVYGTGIVVTNAHCLKFKANGQLDSSNWDRSFYAGFNNGNYLAASKPKALWYDKGADYAVLKLWSPIDQVVGRMGVRWKTIWYFFGNRFMRMISYSGDHCSSWNNCRQKMSTGSSKAAIGSRIYHNLDAKRGSSGSAMWRYENGWPIMIAYNYAEDRNGGEFSLTLNSYTGFNPNFAKPAGNWKYGYDKVKNF